MGTSKQVVGLLLRDFPTVSETFILNEIVLLENLGYDLHVFALNRPGESAMQEGAGPTKARVTYLGGGATLAVIATNIRAWFRSPGRYWSLLKFACARSLRRLSAESLREFLQAVALVENGIRGSHAVHLHAQFSNAPASVAYFARALTGISYSFSAHANDLYSRQYGFLREKIRRAQFVVTCSEYNRRHLLSIAGPDAPVFRCYHGIDLERFKPQPPASPAPCPPVILSIGRFVSKKGFPVLLHALHRLKQREIAFHCHIIGGGELHSTLQRLVALLRLDDCVDLIGGISQAEILDYYRHADIFALACEIQKDGDRDGIPTTLVEAMAMGLAVVSTKVSGIPELIENGVNGLLVRDRDPGALAEALATLIQDRELAGRLGSAGRETVEFEFDARQNVEKIAELLWGALVSQSPHQVSLHAPQSSAFLRQLQEARQVSG